MVRSENSDWTVGVFGTPKKKYDTRSFNSRVHTEAEYKFADSSLGGNIAINPVPQFTKFADLNVGGLFARTDKRGVDSSTMDTAWNENVENTGSFGMGRVYSEAIDDNAHHVHIRFGQPKYTGSIAFFTNMYNRSAAILARDGKWDQTFFTLGKATGLVGAWMVLGAPIMIPLIITSQVLKYTVGLAPSKYYYLKPTMPLWNLALQRALDDNLVYNRLVPFTDFNFGVDTPDVQEKDNKLYETAHELYSALPDIWKSNGKFDSFKMLHRYQVLSDYHRFTMEKLLEESGEADGDYAAAVLAYITRVKYDNILEQGCNSNTLNIGELVKRSFGNYQNQLDPSTDAEYTKYLADIQAAINSKTGVSAEKVLDSQAANSTTESITASNEGTTEPYNPSDPKHYTSFWKGMGDSIGSGVADGMETTLSSIRDGDSWLTYKVDAKPTASDSFSNSTKEASITSTLNSLAGRAKDINFSTSGGNTGFRTIDAVTSGIKSFMGGILDTLHISGLSAVYGSSLVDIPEMYDSSSADIHTESYTIQLRSPYGNDFSRFQCLTVPLLALITGVCPLATGKQTYTSPFLCEIFAKGRQVIRCGIIDSLTITRGVGNLGWRPDGKPLGIDVTFKVKDLSSVVAMPLTQHPGMTDDSNKYSDYMATLAGVSMADLVYSTQRAKLNFNKFKQSWKSTIMSGRITSEVMDSFIFNTARKFGSASTKSTQ